jgi:hypothetical protein
MDLSLSHSDELRQGFSLHLFHHLAPMHFDRGFTGIELRRCASAWLIQRFIDSKARFAFAPENQVPEKSVPFDMFHESGFGHRGEDCTFETLQKEFRIRDRRVKVISEIIHDADLADEKFGRKEGYGIDEILKGWGRQGISDQELLDRGMQLIEGLYHAQS